MKNCFSIAIANQFTPFYKFFFVVMMIIILIIQNPVFGQQDKGLSKKQKIAKIKAEYNEITKNSDKMDREVIFIDNWSSITIDTYQGEIKCAVFANPTEDCFSGYSIYYKDGNPIFIIYEYGCYPALKIKEQEERYYIWDNEIILYLEGKNKRAVNLKENDISLDNFRYMLDEVEKYAKKR